MLLATSLRLTPPLRTRLMKYTHQKQLTKPPPLLCIRPCVDAETCHFFPPPTNATVCNHHPCLLACVTVILYHCEVILNCENEHPTPHSFCLLKGEILSRCLRGDVIRREGVNGMGRGGGREEGEERVRLCKHEIGPMRDVVRFPIISVVLTRDGLFLHKNKTTPHHTHTHSRRQRHHTFLPPPPLIARFVCAEAR